MGQTLEEYQVATRSSFICTFTVLFGDFAVKELLVFLGLTKPVPTPFTLRIM